MRFYHYWPGKAARQHRNFYDSLAQPFFHQGQGSTGCMVLHGFTGTPANIRPISDALAAAGYTVYAPTLSGHGTSLADLDANSSAKLWREDALQAYARLEEAGCTRIYLLGLSMGGLLSSIVAAERPAAGLVLLSTPLRLHRYLIHAQRISPLLPFITTEDRAPKYQRDSSWQGYRGAALRRMYDLEQLSKLARSGLYRISCPALVIQPVEDNRVHPLSVEIARYGIGSGDVRVEYLYNSPHACAAGPERYEVAALCRAFVDEIEAKHG